MRLLPAPISTVIKAKSRSWYDGAIGWRRAAGAEVVPFIVTGPPRSGTSLMTSLLSRKANVIVVNEPLEVMPKVLLTGRIAHKLQGFLNRVARRALREGVVLNKVDPDDPSRTTSDTFNQGAQWQDVKVEIDRGRPLCVGVKATLPFMDCLETLCGSWPALRVIIMIRKPGATLRSWKETFGWQPGLDRAGAGYQFRMYSKVDRSGDALQRRARLWRVMVEQSLAAAAAHPGQVMIVAYEDLLARPGAVLASAFAHLGAVDSALPVDVSDVRAQVRPGYVGFTDAEAASIEKECASAVSALEASG